jgi:YD repeat-containing protein
MAVQTQPLCQYFGVGTGALILIAVRAELTSSRFAKLTSGDFRRMAALTSYFAARLTTRKLTLSSPASSGSVTTTTLVTPGTATVVTSEDDTASSFDKVTSEVNGYVRSVVSSADGVNETYAYDSFGRISKYTDARNAATFSYHDGFQLGGKRSTEHPLTGISLPFAPGPRLGRLVASSPEA